MRNSWISILLLFFATQLLLGQSKDEKKLNIAFYFQKQKLEKGKYYRSIQGDTLSFDKVKCYFSEITWLQDDGDTIAQQKYPQLVDWEAPPSLAVPDALIKNGSGFLQFTVGVPYAYNVNGVFEGDLDPVKGMYWAWQSGFIFVKIEGKSPNCTTYKNQFLFHLGGFSTETNALTRVNLPVTFNSSQLSIDLSYLFDNIKVRKTNAVMSPSAEAVQLANYFKTGIAIQ